MKTLIFIFVLLFGSMRNNSDVFPDLLRSQQNKRTIEWLYYNYKMKSNYIFPLHFEFPLRAYRNLT